VSLISRAYWPDPVATRFLAGFGADVLRIDPPTWDEPGVVPEVTLGKSCARLDLRSSNDRVTCLELLRQADVLVHGYRADALDNLGLDARTRRDIRPGLVDVSLNAYGGRARPFRRQRASARISRPTPAFLRATPEVPPIPQ